MPRNLFQKLFFMALTVLISVHVFVAYNLAIAMGGMSNQVFRLTVHYVPLEFAIAFLLEALIVGRLADRLAFRMVDPRSDRPMVIILAITCSTVLIMCPAMSFAATIIYNGLTAEFLANWLQKMAFNFPLAFFSQIFFIGPVVRLIFGMVFRNQAAENGDGEFETELQPELS